MILQKIAAVLLAGLLAMVCLSGCDVKNLEPPENAGAANAVPVSGLRIRRARNFHIDYLAGGVKLVIDSAGRELLLIPEGARAPAGYEGAAQVSVPVRQAMFSAGACAGFLDVLGAEGARVSPDGWADGEIEGLAGAGFVFADISGETGSALCAALDQLGIPYAVAEENREASIEAYLEWLKFFGAFYGLDQKASDIYDAELDKLKGLYAQTAPVPESSRPVAAFGRICGGVVCTQGGDSVIARQLERAGAVYALKDVEGGSVQMGIEEFLNQCKDADILLYDAPPAHMRGTLLEEDASFAEFKAYQERRVYTLDDGYKMNSARAAEQFEDLIAICQPEKSEEHIFMIYQPLENY